ncbi:MAG: MMPL family transporter [Verrucomicrobia bacterium]|nr:MMPL family transporter [Verrucomicrobiota bacterium]
MDVLDLLPKGIPVVQGIQLYQQKFSNSRELILTLEAPDRESATRAAEIVASSLRASTNLIAQVTWQPPWLENQQQIPELIAHIWLNQPPHAFSALVERLAETNLHAVLTATREELATTLSPTEIARLSYDPFGFTRFPSNVMMLAPGLSQDGEAFSSPTGAFRILFVRAQPALADYRECIAWVDSVRKIVASSIPAEAQAGFTGRPQFVAEIATSMKRDIATSVVGTAVIIAILFWIAHRRWKPMLWLLTLLGLILLSTLALGGLFFGTINVVSMGFAAILLGLAVDYAVVHYQEAVAHSNLSIPEIRRAIAPSIFWAAATTILAFLVLNFGGLPGLAQLGSLVAIGVSLSACIMIYAFLPPLFPERLVEISQFKSSLPIPSSKSSSPAKSRGFFATSKMNRSITVILCVILLGCITILWKGLPKLETSAKALEPRGSQAYAALEAIRKNLNQNREPIWLVLAGHDESEVATRLDAVLPLLEAAVSNQVITRFTLPTALWPRPNNQRSNREGVRRLVESRAGLHRVATAEGFSNDALVLADGVLATWEAASRSSNVFWPTNPLSSWIMERLAVREPTQVWSAGFLFPPAQEGNLSALRQFATTLPRDGVWLGSWPLLGVEILEVVIRNWWKLTLLMLVLVLASLWLAFRSVVEIILSLGALLFSGLILLAVMRAMGMSWNLLNLMAVPLILGTGVDYSLFMQLALRRHDGDLNTAFHSVGKALLLCGGAAVTGFASLGISSNMGMASLGQVCAIGVGANMLISIFALPLLWNRLKRHYPASDSNKPSSLYSAQNWSLGSRAISRIPRNITRCVAWAVGLAYWAGARHRREIVIQNLLPVLRGDRRRAVETSRTMFCGFASKIVDLWRFEAGAHVSDQKTQWMGWETFKEAHARGRGVLIVTPHLGNWEIGAAFFVEHGYPIIVLTQAEPEEQLTQIRIDSRARRGIKTIVVGEDPFAFIEIIKRLQEGCTVAFLVDRPARASAVRVEFLGQPFLASSAAAELARTSGCAIVPGLILQSGSNYSAVILPEVAYDRAALGRREARIRLTQEIMRAFEPAIREHAEQWYHFVPVWPAEQ